MRVVGVVAGPDGPPPVFDVVLQHGVDPTVLTYEQGYAVVCPLDAGRDPAGELVLRLRVRPLDGDPPPRPVRRGRDLGLVVAPGERPEMRQRFAAYAVVVSSRGLLATEYSDRTAVAGHWGMPGGGIDADEQPSAAVLREVSEETSQLVELEALVAVQTSHWVGRSPKGTLEDFQAVRLVYRARCRAPSDPEVLDRGGTTASARWVPLLTWRELAWTHNWADLLDELLGGAES